MGKYEKGILGHFNGKVGTVVGSSWRGVNYMKSTPRKNKKTATEAQLIQQSKFSLVIKFIQPLATLLKSSFNDPAQNMSGVNRALAYNIKHAIAGNYPAFSIDYTKALVSEGILHNAYLPAAVAAGSGQIKFNWTPNSGANANDTDTCIGVAYCAELGQSLFTTNGDMRSGGSHTLDAVLFTGKTVETWIFFVSASGKDCSSSLYTGEVAVS